MKILDYIRLGKPRITWLLVYTAVATYVYAANEINLIHVALFTLFGILTVFGSNAINSYVDRDIDSLMSRTRLRPIPRGAIPPVNGLTMGVIWLISGSLLITLYFGLYAGLSALVGGLYYSIIYTVFLKKRTIWNTVIGGFAGSMPTITGWLAARDTLSIEPIVLALIVFLWTPGHFWSLAYRVREEYRVAGLPMLPVVKDDSYTKKAIVGFYLLTAFSIAASIVFIQPLSYRVTAALSITLLLYASALILRRLDEETAWRSFKISSPTLALIYTGLIISRIVG